MADRQQPSVAVMTEHLRALVEAETPSEDLAACAAGAQVVAGVAAEILGENRAEAVEVDGRVHLRWRWPGERPVLLVGHYDTVWPIGTVARWPFTVDDAAGTATGPGCFDMKAGIVQLFHGLALLEDRSGVEVLLTADEEIGSWSSRGLIAEAAGRARAALILEGSADGALKVARKGCGTYRIVVTGKAAHAGLEPEKGVNSLAALGRLLVQIEQLPRPDLGTTVTPTTARAGTASNVVPAAAELELDVRVELPSEADRVDRDIRTMRSTIPGATVEILGGMSRPPMPSSSSAALFERARVVASGLSWADLSGVEVGGASDGNLTAAAGCPTLDGLGAVGGGAHAEGEHVRVADMPERAVFLAGLTESVRLA